MFTIEGICDWCKNLAWLPNMSILMASATTLAKSVTT